MSLSSFEMILPPHAEDDTERAASPQQLQPYRKVSHILCDEHGSGLERGDENQNIGYMPAWLHSPVAPTVFIQELPGERPHRVVRRDDIGPGGKPTVQLIEQPFVICRAYPSIKFLKDDG